MDRKLNEEEIEEFKNSKILTYEEVKKFLEYKELDDKQRDMILNIIIKLRTIDKDLKLFPANNHEYKLLKVNPEEILEFENSKNVTLPLSFKWFIQEVGEGFCPGQYVFGLRNSFNKFFSLESDCFSDMIFTIAHEGCTFFTILGLNEKNYGKVAEYCADFDLEELWDVEDREEAIKILDNFKGFKIDFLDWYKHNLINEFRKFNNPNKSSIYF